MKKLTPSSEISGEDDSETADLREMLREATEFMLSFRWCTMIRESYLGMGIGGVVGVFLLKIVPAKADVDEWLWVIVGDLPPAYIVTDNAPNAACALAAYIQEMRRWADAAKNGKTVTDLIPLNVPATPENAKELAGRLDFLKTEVLSQYLDDLRSCSEEEEF